MNSKAADDLNEAVALMLAGLNSTSILHCGRKARVLSALLEQKHHPAQSLVKGFTDDIGRLYKSVLVLERDPEVIRRNVLASVLMSLSPLLVGLQDLFSTAQFPLWKIGTEGIVLGLEVLGTTQYLEAAKLISGTEYECSLWELEGRALELTALRSSVGDLAEPQKALADFFDGLKGDHYRPDQRPVVFFVLCLVLAAISYSMVRSAFK